MKNRLFLLSLLASLLLISCTDTDSELKDTSHSAPYDLLVDMNNDSINEFKIQFNTTITNDKDGEMNGYLFTLNNTQFLVDTTSDVTAFLFTGDSVMSTPEYPTIYTTDILPIIKKTKQSDSYWTVNSYLGLNTVYIGLKFQDAQSNWKVGWVKINFDLLTGEPTIVSKKVGTDKCIINS